MLKDVKFYIHFFCYSFKKKNTNSHKCIFSIFLSKQLARTQTYNRQIVTLLQILISLTSSSQSLSWVISPYLYIVSPFCFTSNSPDLLLISSSDIVTSIADFCTSNFDPCVYLRQHIPSHSSSSQLKYDAVHWLPSHIGQDV